MQRPSCACYACSVIIPPLWITGTPENQWKDSGWVYNGIFYPCEYTDDLNGADMLIGRVLEQWYREDKERHKRFIESRKV